MFTEEIENLLTEKFKEEGFLDCFLVEIEQNGKHLGVFMDSDSPLSFDRCKEVSRIVEAFLDDKKYLGEDYLFEVSSPIYQKYWSKYYREIWHRGKSRGCSDFSR